ncbi:hypothetical protein BLA18110_05006 [Burkholderia lata]|nr:hypothetical protein BLA18110_05006 [Burkholderia lata]
MSASAGKQYAPINRRERDVEPGDALHGNQREQQKVTFEICAISMMFDFYRRHERYYSASLSRDIRYPKRDLDQAPLRRFVIPDNQALDVGANIDFIAPSCSRRPMRVAQSLLPQFLNFMQRSRRWLPTASYTWFGIPSDPSTHHKSSAVISRSEVRVPRGQTAMHNHAQRGTASLPAPCHNHRDFWRSAACVPTPVKRDTTTI